MIARILPAALALLALLVASPSTHAASTVRLYDSGFEPRLLTVDAGETIHFENRSGKDFSVTSAKGLFDSGTLGRNGVFTVNLSVPGLHAYQSTGTGSPGGYVLVLSNKLGGDPTDKVDVRLPDIPFPAADEDSVGTHPGFGVKASRTRILVGFEPDATVAQANAALEDAGVRIIGGKPSLGLLLVETSTGWSSSFEYLDEALASLRAARGVRFAAMSPQIEGAAAPRRADAITMGIAPGWDWDDPFGKGNAGLVTSNFPEAWNLLEPLRRKRSNVITGIVDKGFEPNHPDTPGLQVQTQLGSESLGNVPDAHGQHVAGIVGAAYDNDAEAVAGRSRGVSGGNPLAKMYAYSSDGFANGPTFNTGVFSGAYVLDRQVELLDAVLRTRPAALRVINHSMTGVNFDPALWKLAHQYTACGPGTADDDLKTVIEPCNPNNSDRWQREIANMGMAAAAVLREASRQGVLIVQAAGNDGASFCAGGPCTVGGAAPTPIDTASNTEISWAARHWNDDAVAGQSGLVNPVLTVQNTGQNGAPAADSALNADISAPGTGILSTIPGGTYDRMSGTSMAAPQVTAAAGLLLADEPAMPLGTLRKRLLDWGAGRPAGSGQLQFTWSMTDRMNRDDDGDGLVDYPLSTGDVAPSQWQVDLDACDSSLSGKTIGTYTWSVNGAPVGSTGDCTFRWRPAAEGTYSVTLTATAPGGESQSVTQQVKVEDVLIVSVGDSIASGEGNPDIESPFSVWQEDRCHRSAYAGPAQAARELEQEDAHSSVTFVHLACSGARMRGDVEDDLTTIKLGPLGIGGLLTPYEGVTEHDTDSPCAASRRTSSECEPPQLEAAKALLGTREPDALTISIGANDMIFSKILMECMWPNNDCTTNEGGKGLFDNRIVRLEERYYAVAQKIKELWPNLDPSRVFITQYPDLTQDQTGNVNLSCGAASGINQKEAEWAADVVLPALNGKVAAAAAAHGWTLASGIPESFHRHGYCSNDSWIVDLSGSAVFQGGKDGAFHPNYQGHKSYAKFILQALRPKLALPAATAPRTTPRDRAPRLNAFRSLAAGGRATRVADFNDPSEDGNRRVIRTVNADGTTTETADSKRGLDATEKAAPDGRVDMRDLRRYRDAWLQRCLADSDGCPAAGDISLDGAELHPKRDLNFDGCVTGDPGLCGAREHYFSRFDLNGDRLIDPFAKALVPWKADGAAADGRSDGLAMTDLEVLEAAWTGGDGAEGWAKNDIEMPLLRSGDVEVQADAVLDTGAAKADLQIRRKAGGAPVGPKRTIRRRDGSIVMTVPVSNPAEELELVATASSADGTQTSTSAPFTLEYGQDRSVAVCPNVSLKAMPRGVPADGTSTSVITATVHKCGTREIADRPVSFAIAPGGASLQTVSGTTDLAGKATALFKAGNVIDAYTVTATVDMGEGAEPLKAEIVVKTVPTVKVKYVWTQTVESWSETGKTRWNGLPNPNLLPDCVGAGTDYCIDSFQVGMNNPVQPVIKRAGTLTGGGTEFDLTEELAGHAGSSKSTWALTFNADGSTEEGHKFVNWWVTNPTEYTDKPVRGLTAHDEPAGLRLNGIQAIGDLTYKYQLQHAGGSSGVDPIEGHSANSSYFLIPQGDSSIRFAANPGQDITFNRDGENFKPFTSCGVIEQDLTTQPGYYVHGTSDYIAGATTIGRKYTYAMGDRPLPTGPGNLKVRYAFAAVAAYEGRTAPDPVLPDCTVSNPPDAAFDFEPARGEVAKEGRSVHFTDRSTDVDNDISKLEWNFGDGHKRTGAMPFHIYDDNGTYEVELKVTDAKGNTDTTTRQVVVENEAPEADILDATAQVDQLTVRYRMLDPGHEDKQNLSWKLTSTNPAFPAEQGTDHAGVWWRGPYTGLPAGTYPLTLTVTDKDGATASDDAVVVVTETAPPPEPVPAPRTYATCVSTVTMDGEERDFLDLVNEYREDNGLEPVEVSATLTKAAERHADEMAAKDYMAHDGKDGSTPASRAFDAGFPKTAGVGENLAETETASESLWAWRGSSTGHNENMLNPAWKTIGIARKKGSKWRWATSYGTVQDCPSSVAPGRTPEPAPGFAPTTSGDGVEVQKADAPETKEAPVQREAAAFGDTGNLMLQATAEPAAKPLYAPTVALAMAEDRGRAGRPYSVTNRSRDAHGEPLATRVKFGDETAEVELAANATTTHTYPALDSWQSYKIQASTTDSAAKPSALERLLEVWPDDPPDLFIKDNPGYAVANAPYKVTVEMTDPHRGEPLAGLELTFSVGDRQVKATTSEGGIAEVNLTLLDQEGTQTIKVAFPGNAHWKPAEETKVVEALVNHAPVAKPGGPYVVGEGGTLKLNGAASTETDPTWFDEIKSWTWDLDGDGEFDDATGRLPLPIQGDELDEKVCAGTCVAGQAYPVKLKVTDSYGMSGTAATTVKFVADFDLLLGNEVKTVTPGQSNSFAVSVIGSASFKEPVTLTALDLPDGITASFSQNPVTPSGISVLTLTAAPGLENTGTYPIKIRGTAGAITKEIGSDLNLAFGLVPICVGQITGQVTDKTTGAPLAGVYVGLSGVNGVHTDASGRYVIDGVPLGWNNAPVQPFVNATRSGYWSAAVTGNVACGAPGEVNIQMLDVRKGKMRAKVVDKDTQQPIPGAAAYEQNCSWFCSYTKVAEAGQDGWFEHSATLGHNNGDTYWPGKVEATDYWYDAHAVLLKEGQTTETKYELVKKCSATVKGGQVRYMGSDLPAKKAGVAVYLSGGWSPDFTTVTDDEGNFTVDRSVTLGYNNAATSVRAYPTPPADAPEGTTGFNGYFELSSCGKQATVTLMLKAPKRNYGTLTGTVTDQETGAPLADRYVSMGGRSEKTDANGKYTFTDVLVGNDDQTQTYVSASVEPTGYYAATSSGYVKAGETSTLDLKPLKKRFGALNIKVVDAVTGAPVPGAQVTWNYSCSYLCWYTDRAGAATGRNIDLQMNNVDRQLGLIATAGGYWAQGKTVTLKADQTSEVEFRLQPECAPASVGGTVVNAETGAPIHNATVNGGGQSASTDAAGKFLIEGIKPSEGNNPRQVWLTASAQGFFSQTKEITIFCGAKITVDFARTSKTGTLVGTVTDGATGAPLADAFVGTEFGGTTKTDAQGHYRIEQVPLGDLNADREWAVNVKPASGYKAKTQKFIASKDAEVRLDFAFSTSNVAPAAAGKTVQLDEDSHVEFEVAGSDGDGDALTYHVMKFPQHGTLSGRLPNVRYTPDSNYNGPDEFEFLVNDSVASSQQAKVQIDVKPVNDAPWAVADHLDSLPDTVLRIPAADLLANDTEVDDETPSIIKVEPNHAEAKAELDPVTGDVVFTPPPGWSSDIQYAFVRYTIADAAGQQSWAWIYIRVKAGPAAPTCLDRKLTMARDTTLESSVACTDANGDPVTHALLSDPPEGTFSLAGDGTFTYTPPAGFVGTRTFTYRGTDGTLQSPVRTVTIDVVEPNEAPQCTAVEASTKEDAPVELTLACTDADGDQLQYAISRQPGHGTLKAAGGAKFAYQPDADWSGDDTFAFTASDGKAQSAAATATVHVAPGADAPTAGADALATDEDAPLAVPAATLLANDVDGDGGTLKIDAVDGAENGKVALDGGTVTFTPAPNHHGAARFRYSVANAAGAKASAVADVTVRPVNDAPVATDDDAPGTGRSRTFAAAALLGNDTDIDGDALTVTAVGDAQHGTVALNAGTIGFAADPGFEGVAAFRYTVADAAGATHSATVRVLVGPIKGTQQLLECQDKPVVLEDVLPAGNQVKLRGLVDPVNAGRSVAITIEPSHKVVAQATVGPDGVFETTANMPKAKLAKRARYTATLGEHRSRELKLMRRMVVSRVEVQAGTVTIEGRVTGPLAAKARDRVIEVREQAVCADGKTVARVTPRKDGRFRVQIPRRADQVGAVYRLFTKVPKAGGRKAKLFPTFTLPRAVDF